MIDHVVGLIGWPVSHSISPPMHNSAFLEIGFCRWRYLPMPVPQDPKERIGEAVRGIRALGFRGANVTVPHKEAVLSHLDHLTSEARAIGAVNTIAVDADGGLVGHNTDGQGFILDLKEHGIDPRDLKIALLGAGGSARAIAHALLEAGCRTLIILNRTQKKALDLSSSLMVSFPAADIEAWPLSRESFQKVGFADLVINATSLGLNASGDDDHLYEGMGLCPTQVAYDIVYNPKPTRFLREAKSMGARTITGIGMLIHQGALSFELWTGHRAPLLVMKEAAFKALADK